MEKVFEDMIKIIEVNDFSVTIEEDNEDYIIFDFGKYSPAGQDFHFLAQAEKRDIDNLIYNILNVYQNFDVSEETYLWLDGTGHGINGAPDDMIDVYKDMEACEKSINDLYEIVNKFWQIYEEEC